MLGGGIVVRPVNQRRSAGIVYELPANRDAITGADRNRRRDVDVVDDFERQPVVGSTIEGFMPRVAHGSGEKSRRRGDGRTKIDLGR